MGIGEPVQWYLFLAVRRERWLPGNKGTSPMVFIPASKEGRMAGSKQGSITVVFIPANKEGRIADSE